MQAALASEGYQTEVLGNCGSEVAQLGLKYVHNDTCYPALLVIGQFLDALNSGKYDLDHTALLITQTGGGCLRPTTSSCCARRSSRRATAISRSIAELLRSGKGSGLPLTVPLLRKGHCVDLLRRYAGRPAQPDPRLRGPQGRRRRHDRKWIATIQGWIRGDRNYSAHDMKRRFYDIAKDYADHPHHPRTEGQGRRCRRNLRQIFAAGQQ